jgi:hypothetical protein
MVLVYCLVNFVDIFMASFYFNDQEQDKISLFCIYFHNPIYFNKF